VGHAQAFSFKYSPRPGTPAATMADQIAAEVMDERLQRLQALLNTQQHDFNRTTLGKRVPVLIERKGKLDGQMLGKSPWLQSVHLQTDAPIGAMVEVEIVSAGPNSLGGAGLVAAAA
jgi:tRNA-2-methylthio-N6-dimethylallyladenosine synthase